ncbi:isochorismatase family protein [Halioxenophilus aromaticivorans]|uniref:N-carbamoylsarcosine amidohydrolase n=1 Tax=Halioxenophilus aromaticivorans TaxID=1306992 RepID=A0AAV3U773_9ALTE
MATLDSTDLSLGKKPAIIVVDITPGFTNPECSLGSNADSVVEANIALLKVFRERNFPIFYTTVVYRDASEARVFREKIPCVSDLAVDSPWVDIDPRLEPQPGEVVVEKLWPSAFFGTALAQQLRAVGADSLVVTGLSTSGCVRATVLDGMQHEYPVIVPREAVGDRDAEAHASNLRDMQLKIASVKPLAEVIDELNGIEV